MNTHKPKPYPTPKPSPSDEPTPSPAPEPTETPAPEPTLEPSPTPEPSSTPTPEPSTAIGEPVFPEEHPPVTSTSVPVPVVRELAETGPGDVSLPLAGLGLVVVIAGWMLTRRARRGQQ